MSQAPEVRRMTTTEGGQNGKNVFVDCKGELNSGELMTGSLTIPAVSGLTISNEAVSNASFLINEGEPDERTVPAGEGVQFNVKSTTAGTYTITGWANTDSTPSQTVDFIVKLKVE